MRATLADVLGRCYAFSRKKVLDKLSNTQILALISITMAPGARLSIIEALG
jgi:hypothetical protein